MRTYDVLVGNVGTVRRDVTFSEARKAFNEYVKQSKANVGRAGGESVTILEYWNTRTEIVKEYTGKNDRIEF